MIEIYQNILENKIFEHDSVFCVFLKIFVKFEKNLQPPHSGALYFTTRLCNLAAKYSSTLSRPKYEMATASPTQGIRS